MGNYTIFRCSKILGEAGKKEILQQMFRNSRSQIVFRTDIFQKLSSSAPVLPSSPISFLFFSLCLFVCFNCSLVLIIRKSDV